MKNFTPEKLAAASRYQNYFPTLPQNVQADVLARMAELIEEERAYCDTSTWRR